MVNHVNTGRYKVQSGDTPRSVAEMVYRDGSLYHVLLKSNPFEWNEGDTIFVPNKAGRETEMKVDEAIFDVIERMFPNQPIHYYIERFYAWNGGNECSPEVGDIVYVPER